MSISDKVAIELFAKAIYDDNRLQKGPNYDRWNSIQTKSRNSWRKRAKELIDEQD